MKILQSEMEAIALTQPEMRTVLDPTTLEEVDHYGYDAEIQYKRKPNQTRLIICNSSDVINAGETVMITYHSGMRCYQHSRPIIVSNQYNCVGDFYYTDGRPAN